MMLRHRRAFAAAAWALLSTACSGADEPAGAPLRPPAVAVNQGTVEGQLAGATRVFLGIPYGAAPIGELRFALPEPAPDWQGTLRAGAFGPACMQNAAGLSFFPGYPTWGALPMSEDCLTLNVYAPLDTAEADLPVMVFIHGGGLQGGASSEYDGRALSEAGRLIVVTMNYRLGALGFIAHPALDAELGSPSGNLGLYDQQLALRWVADNIAAFGGDPGNVTLFGESAGALSTCLHMLARGSEALAHRFILESGPCLHQKFESPAARSGVEDSSNELVADLCAGATDIVSCLRNLDAAALANWEPGPANDVLTAYVDGSLIPATPDELVARGEFNHGPMIVGSNLDEGAFMMLESVSGKAIMTPAELEIAIDYLFPAHAAEIAAHYGEAATDEQATRIMYSLITDAGFRCPSRETARTLSAQGVPVYLYSFDVLPGAHAQELDYVFNRPIISPLFPEAPLPLLEDVARAVAGYWTSFARSGDPNGEGRTPWPRFETTADEHLGLASPVQTGTGLSKHICDLMTAK